VVLVLGLVFDVLDPLEAGLCRHKLEDVVDHEGAAELRLEGGSFESRPDLESLASELSRVLDVEESWRPSDLL